MKVVCSCVRKEKEKKDKEGKLWEWMGHENVIVIMKRLFLKIQQEIDFDKTLKPNER